MVSHRYKSFQFGQKSAKIASQAANNHPASAHLISTGKCLLSFFYMDQFPKNNDRQYTTLLLPLYPARCPSSNVDRSFLLQSFENHQNQSTNS
jgi:hypothetical protein